MSIRRVLAVVALAGTLVLVVASPASAHAELLQSNPAPGQVLTKPPSEITLSFSEPVEVSARSVKAYDADGERVDDGGVDHLGDTVRLPLPDLTKGSYVVTWRVTSDDSHPVEGAFTFQIGAAGNANSRAVTSLAQRLLSDEKGDAVVGVLLGVTRWFVFAGLALLLGVAAFSVIVFPAARASRWTRRLVWGGWITLTVATVLGLLMYGPYASGLGLGDAFQSSLLGDTLDTRFGLVWLVRLVLLLAALPLLRALLARGATDGDGDGDSDGGGEGSPRPLPRWFAPAAVPLAVVLSSTPGLAGHAVTGDWQTVAIITDVLHVLAMAVWLGGLVAVAAILLPGRSAAELRATLPRWSKLAFGCVATLVVTGAFQTWRQVGSLDALRTTDYGRILIVKLVLFSLILVLAALSREVVFRLYHEPTDAVPAGGMPVVAGGADDDPPPDRAGDQGRWGADPDWDDDWALDEATELRRLRRSVWAEVVVAAAVLAATALLVNAAPARAVAEGRNGGAVGVTLKSKKVWVDVTLTPGRAGTNDVHVSTLEPNGAPEGVEDLTITFSLPDKKIAPIDVPLRDLGPGHYLSPGFDLPFNGEWRVVAKPRLSQFEEPALTGTISVG